MSEPRTETGGPNRTPRSEIGPAVSANRKKEPVLLLDLSTSMDWNAASETGPDWPDLTSRRAIVIGALRGLVRVLEKEDSEATAEQAGGSDELEGRARRLRRRVWRQGPRRAADHAHPRAHRWRGRRLDGI